MPQRTPPEDYYDEPDAARDDRADEDVYYAHDDFDDYDDAGDDGGYGGYSDYDEYVEDAGADPYGARYEVAPDDADTSLEMYDAVYQKAATRAEKKLDRPRRRRKPPAPPPPGPLRAFWLRLRGAALRGALWIAAIALALGVFAYYWARPASDQAAFQAPSIAPPVVRCGDASGSWPADVPIASHTLPALINHQLSWVGEQHGYQFHGGAGQVWKITVEARGGSGVDPLVRLFDEDGRELAAADDRSAQDFTADLTFVLPRSGAYCVLVASSQGGMTSGAYRLSAWIID